jgi:uncharacterized protein YjbI with pentapeptide repeats
MLSKIKRWGRIVQSRGLRVGKKLFVFLRLLFLVTGAVGTLLILEKYLGGNSIQDALSILKTPSSILKTLQESVILSSLDSVAIITGLIMFILFGQTEQRRQQRADALAQMELSQDLKKSGSTKSLLEDLNQNGESFRCFEFRNELDLEKINLQNVDLSRAKLNGVILTNSNIKDGNFWGAELKNSDFKRADLQGILFQHAILKKTDFSNCKLQDASFENADLEGCIFNDSNLEKCIFSHANLERCTFLNANLKGANFEQADHLPLDQIKLAHSWEKAIFSPSDRVQLQNPQQV